MSDLAQSKAELFAITGGAKDGSMEGYKLPKGIISATSIIPQQVQGILASQFTSVGLNFDISKLALNKDNRETLRQLRETVELITNNSKLLPEIASCLKKAMKAAGKQAEFNADIAKAALRQQTKIDDAQADILIALMGYNQGRDKKQAKLERKFQQQQAITQAESRYHNEVWGKERQIIDAKYDFLTDVAMARMATDEKKAKATADRKIQSENWQQEAL